MAKKTTNPEFRKLIFYKCGGMCAYCGFELMFNNFHIDHVKPKKRRMNNCEHGGDEENNLMPSCCMCNLSKQSMELEVWRKQLLLKIHRLNRDSSIYRLCLKFKLIEETNIPIVFYFEKLYSNSY